MSQTGRGGVCARRFSRWRISRDAAADLADYLVRRGITFRDAHEIVGRAVRAGVDQDRRHGDADGRHRLVEAAQPGQEAGEHEELERLLRRAGQRHAHRLIRDERGRGRVELQPVEHVAEARVRDAERRAVRVEPVPVRGNGEVAAAGEGEREDGSGRPAAGQGQRDLIGLGPARVIGDLDLRPAVLVGKRADRDGRELPRRGGGGEEEGGEKGAQGA